MSAGYNKPESNHIETLYLHFPVQYPQYYVSWQAQVTPHGTNNKDYNEV